MDQAEEHEERVTPDCVCWDGNPDNFEGARRDCPTHGEIRLREEGDPADLPGMWEPADFTGGLDEVRP